MNAELFLNIAARRIGIFKYNLQFLPGSKGSRVRGEGEGWMCTLSVLSARFALFGVN